MSKHHWDDSFSDEAYVYGETENLFIHQQSKIIPTSSKVGCFAEGEGRNAIYLAKLGHEVTAYDQSTIGLHKANDLAHENGVHIDTVAMDLTTEKVPAHQFDAAIMVFGHVPKGSQPYLIQNMIDAVKPGGYVLFEVYSENQLSYKTGGPPSIEMLYNSADVLDWIKGYKCLHFYYGEAVRNEGKKTYWTRACHSNHHTSIIKNHCAFHI